MAVPLGSGRGVQRYLVDWYGAEVEEFGRMIGHQADEHLPAAAVGEEATV